MPASIGLHVPRVRCVDETGGSIKEKFGNDEIYLGAVFVAISANKAFDVRVVGAKTVGENFDDGETVNWNRDLFRFELGDAAVYPYPKAVIAALVLAEHDAGNGRNKFLEELAQKFNDTLSAAALTGVVATAARRYRDAATQQQKQNDANFVVKSLEEWAGKKIAELGDALLRKASAWVGDDVFRPVIKRLEIPLESHTWNGSADTPDEIAEFTGHDGKYQVTMRWQLRRTLVVTPTRLGTVVPVA